MAILSGAFDSYKDKINYREGVSDDGTRRLDRHDRHAGGDIRLQLDRGSRPTQSFPLSRTFIEGRHGNMAALMASSAEPQPISQEEVGTETGIGRRGCSQNAHRSVQAVNRIVFYLTLMDHLRGLTTTLHLFFKSKKKLDSLQLPRSLCTLNNNATTNDLLVLWNPQACNDNVDCDRDK